MTKVPNNPQAQRLGKGDFAEEWPICANIQTLVLR